MSAEVTQSNNWVQLQANVFTRWVQNQLRGYKNVHVDKITKDLSNGVALIELAKTLTHKDTPRDWSNLPKRTVDMVQNCDLAVEMFQKDGVDLVGISGKDINDNNEKLILGLVWSLILHYSIGRSVQIDTKKNLQNDSKRKSKNEISALKSWALERTENYPNIHNFKPYELSMCALLDSYVPNRINYYSLNPDDKENNSKLATSVMNDLEIPILIYPDDVKNNDSNIDDKTLLTQLSCMKSVLENSALNLKSRVTNKKDEKPDTESDTESSNEDKFENNNLDQRPAANKATNNQSAHDFDTVLYNEDSIDHEGQIKSDSVEQRDLELEYHLTDNLLKKDSLLKIDSRDEKLANRNVKYERIQEDHLSFYEKYIQRFMDSIVRFFSQPEKEGPLPRVRGYHMINSPIIPYIYSVDYSSQ